MSICLSHHGFHKILVHEIILAKADWAALVNNAGSPSIQSYDTRNPTKVGKHIGLLSLCRVVSTQNIITIGNPIPRWWTQLTCKFEKKLECIIILTPILDGISCYKLDYRQVSNIRRTKSQHLKRFLYRLAAVFAESLKARYQVENEDVVGAAPTGDAPTTSE